MEFSPYLDAIQQLKGETYGEKMQSITKTAKKIIKDCETSNTSIEDSQVFEEFPEVLVPLIQLKIAEILKKPEGILNALRSNNPDVFTPALKVKWFFNGSVENCPNAHDFQNHVWPYVSTKNRWHIISTIAKNAAHYPSTIVEEFYSTISEMYGRVAAQPFLINCSSSFINHIITHHAIKFDAKDFQSLLLREYPVAIKYLKLCASKDNDHTKNMYPPLENYQKFLGYLLKKNDAKSVIELLEMCKDSSQISFARQSTQLFIENELDTLLKKPHTFMPVLSLKDVTDELTPTGFEMLFKNLFPKELKEFNFQNLYDYLKYISEEQKLPLMLSTFEQVYKVSLLDCDDKITPEVLKVLPFSKRIKQARKKLETDKNWYNVGDNIENSWVCYLSVEESIPILNQKIFNTTDGCQQIKLINQMVYTCKVNNDKKALLDVLKLVLIQHKCEHWNFLDFLNRLLIDFKEQCLSEEHWEVLDEFIKNALFKKTIFIHEKELRDFIIWGIKNDLLNNLPITQKIDLLTERNINGRISDWNLFNKIPKFEQLCLDQFIESIPRVYEEIYDNSSWSWIDLVYSFMEAIYDFNKRNSTGEAESIYIESNPLFSEEVQKLVSDQTLNQKYFPKIKQMKQLLKINEPDLYSLWVKECEQPETLTCDLLKHIANPYQYYLKDCEQYYEYFKNHIDDQYIQYLITNSRWYQDLPIKFLERSLKDIIDNQDDNALKFLALLVEGPVFEEFIKSQTANFTNTNVENSTKKCFSKSVITEAIKAIQTLPSIEFIIDLFKENDVEVINKCFYKIALQVPADKLQLCCEMLINEKPAIAKLCVKIIQECRTAQQYRQTLIDLWRTRELRLIDSCVVRNIYDAFIDKPCTETWEIVKECFNSLRLADDYIFSYISSLDKISHEFIADYVKLLLAVFKNFGDKINSFGAEGVWFNTNKLLRNLPNYLAEFFPEEQHEEILETYLADLSLPKDVLLAAQTYLVNCYILPAKDKLDSRLKFFSNLFINVLQHEEKIYDPDNFIPLYLVNDFLEGLISNVLPILYSPTKTKLINTILDAFLFVRKPQEAPKFYCKFIVASLYNDQTSPKELGLRISEIVPGLIKNSVVSVFLVSESLFDFLHRFYFNFGTEGQLDIVESLLESNDDNNILLAAHLLLWQYFKVNNSSRFWKIVELLKKHDNIAVVSCANLIISGFTYQLTI